MTKELIILIGNIGTGKSTLVKSYQEKGYIVIARDQLRYAIGGGTYVYNENFEPLIRNLDIQMFIAFVAIGVNLIVDEVNINKSMRKEYLHYAKLFGYHITAIDMPRLCMGEAVNRRMRNPHGQPSVDLWNKVWTKFESLYEEPTKIEGFDRIIKRKKS